MFFFPYAPNICDFLKMIGHSGSTKDKMFILVTCNLMVVATLSTFSSLTLGSQQSSGTYFLKNLYLVQNRRVDRIGKTMFVFEISNNGG